MISESTENGFSVIIKPELLHQVGITVEMLANEIHLRHYLVQWSKCCDANHQFISAKSTEKIREHRRFDERAHCLHPGVLDYFSTHAKF